MSPATERHRFNFTRELVIIGLLGRTPFGPKT
jgi:hypothetical protein